MAKASPPTHWSMSLVLLLNRVALGLYFVLAGVTKFRMGIEPFVDKAVQPNAPAWLPQSMALSYGVALPWVEVAAGALLIVGLFSRVAAGVLALVLASIMVAMGVQQEGTPFSFVVVFCTLSLLLIFTGPGSWSIDGRFWQRGK